MTWYPYLSRDGLWFLVKLSVDSNSTQAVFVSLKICALTSFTRNLLCWILKRKRSSQMKSDSNFSRYLMAQLYDQKYTGCNFRRRLFIDEPLIYARGIIVLERKYHVS